jgi:AraC family transcriptional regulator of arabinose operon
MAGSGMDSINGYRKNRGIVVSGHFTKDDSYSINRAAGDADWFMTYTLDGLGAFRIRDSITYCSRGDLIIIRPGIPQHYTTVKGNMWEFMWVHFHPPSDWDFLQQLREREQQSGIFHLKLDKPEPFEGIGNAFDRINKFQHTSVPLSLNGVEEILLRIRHYQGATGQHYDPRIDEVINYLAEHIKESHSIDVLARMVHLSPSRLRHLYKQEVGESIVETLTRMRLRQASRLLELTAMPISEIAEEVGFHSSFYFTSRFTEHYGLNPSTYRKNFRTNR